MGNLATGGFSHAAKKSGGTCCGVTMPVTALANGLQGILRDKNDDLGVLESWCWVGFALLCTLHITMQLLQIHV